MKISLEAAEQLCKEQETKTGQFEIAVFYFDLLMIPGSFYVYETGYVVFLNRENGLFYKLYFIGRITDGGIAYYYGPTNSCYSRNNILAQQVKPVTKTVYE